MDRGTDAGAGKMREAAAARIRSPSAQAAFIGSGAWGSVWPQYADPTFQAGKIVQMCFVHTAGFDIIGNLLTVCTWQREAGESVLPLEHGVLVRISVGQGERNASRTLKQWQGLFPSASVVILLSYESFQGALNAVSAMLPRSYVDWNPATQRTVPIPPSLALNSSAGSGAYAWIYLRPEIFLLQQHIRLPFEVVGISGSIYFIWMQTGECRLLVSLSNPFPEGRRGWTSLLNNHMDDQRQWADMQEHALSQWQVLFPPSVAVHIQLLQNTAFEHTIKECLYCQANSTNFFCGGGINFCFQGNGTYDGTYGRTGPNPPNPPNPPDSLRGDIVRIFNSDSESRSSELEEEDASADLEGPRADHDRGLGRAMVARKSAPCRLWILHEFNPDVDSDSEEKKEEEEEEGSFKSDEGHEEDPEHDRATQV